MRELNMNEIKAVSGGEMTPSEGASMILALGAAGGPATMAFALPIAAALLLL